MNEPALNATLAFALSAVATEHFFSAGMSSPWSVQKFTQSPEDAKLAMKLFWLSVGASTAFAVTVGLLVQDNRALLFSLLATAGVSALMYWEYSQAIQGKL